MARKLTKKLVDALTYEGAVSERGTKGLHIVMDNQIPGFHLRLFPSGKKSYGLVFKLKGRKRFISIGRADKSRWTLPGEVKPSAGNRIGEDRS